MPATVTLSSTTLAAAAGAFDSQIKVASTSGLIPGTRLFVDQELMAVVSLGVSPWVNVLRGVDGTAAAAHHAQSVLWIGRADQFFRSDPVGRPPAEVLVSPHINAAAGNVWFAQGDFGSGPAAVRWWEKQTTTHAAGALGVIGTSVSGPESST